MELLQEYNRKYRARRKRNHILLIAAVLAALLLGACVAIEPLREAVFGAIITKYEDYFDFEWDREVEEVSEVSEYPYIPSTFGYVPEGYVLIENTQVPGYVHMYFEKTTNDNIVYSVEPVLKETMYDTGYGIIAENMAGNRHLLMIGEKTNSIYLIWRDSTYSYVLSGFIDTEELIKMFENLS